MHPWITIHEVLRRIQICFAVLNHTRRLYSFRPRNLSEHRASHKEHFHQEAVDTRSRVPMSSLLSLAFDSGWLPTGPHESFSILIAHRGSDQQSVLIRGDAARSYSESFRGQLGFNLEDLCSSCGPSSGLVGAPGPVGGREATQIHREP